MKTLNKLIALAIVLIAFSTLSNAQPPGAVATATATATIVTPIAISKVTDMNFGNVGAGTTAGTVVLTPASGRSATGGSTIVVAAPGTVTAASFTVTGTTAYTYVITLPTTVTLTKAVTLETMTATTFTSNPSATGVLTAGTQTLQVGATLNVGAAQVAGTYVSGNFDVTVNYN